LNRIRGLAFETDAQVNYGSAGGAVVDLQGRVMGLAADINSSQESRHGINSGVAFAVPVSQLLDVLPRLKAGHDIQARAHPFLGIGFKNDEEDIDGVYVDRVITHSGAEQAGLKSGDVIVGLNGKEVFTRPDFLEQVSGLKPGDVIQLKIRRGEATLAVSLTVGTRPKP